MGIRVAQALVSIVTRSASDWPMMQGAAELLDQFEIAYGVTISSAHRPPQRQVADRGIQVSIAEAGEATHLAARVARDSEALQQQLLQGRA